MASDAELIQQLRERIEELEEEVRQLRAELVPNDTPLLNFLSRNEMTLLMGIYRREIANYAYLDKITEQGDKYNRFTDIEHEHLRAKVSIWKLRQKMRKHGIEIKTCRGIGYYLNDKNKAKLKQLMEKKDGKA